MRLHPILAILALSAAPRAATAQCDRADLAAILPLVGTTSVRRLYPAVVAPGADLIMEGVDLEDVYYSPARDRLRFHFLSYAQGLGIVSAIPISRDYIFLDPQHIRVRVPESVPDLPGRVNVHFEFVPDKCPAGAQYAGFSMGILTTPVFDVVTPMTSPVPPDAVARLYITQVTDESAILRWDDVRGELGYRFYVKEAAASDWGEIPLQAETTSHELRDLKPDTSYEAYIIAYNAFGESAPSLVLQFLTLPAPTPPPPAPDPEETWVLVHDNVTTIEQGFTTTAPPTPLSRSRTGLPYVASLAEAHLDMNSNGQMDFCASMGAQSHLPFPLSTEGRPATQTGRTYENYLGSLLVDGSSKRANLTAVIVLEPTEGSRGNKSFVSLQLAWDEANRTIEVVDFRGGDWIPGDGKTMITTQWVWVAPNWQVSAPTAQGPGILRGGVRAIVTVFETFSYLDSSGDPAVGIIRHDADVEVQFAAPVYRDDDT